MTKLCVKGVEGLPAEILPARMWIEWALMKMSRVSSAITVPSISMKLAGLGFMSRRIVQLAFTYTSSMKPGTVLLGHWLALLQYRTKDYLTIIPAEEGSFGAGGIGQTYLQKMAFTSVYS